MVKFLEAVLMLSGMIIGVGMFAIPFSFARAGFLLGAIELVILGAAVLAMHLAYGEIVLGTSTRHRLPGYVKMYLGRPAALLAWGSALFGIAGALVAYIIVGAIFLRGTLPLFLGGMGDGALALIFIALGALVALLPLRKEALVNGILTAVLIGFIVFLSVSLIPKVSPAQLTGVRLEGFFFPYGILLFALTGATAIPELVPLLGRSRRKVRLAIAAGSCIPVLVYILFAAGVVGTVGSSASPEAIQGLRSVAGESVVQIGSLIGLLAVFTSFVVLTTAFSSLLALDFGAGRGTARSLSIAIPAALYLLGFQNFIAIIGVVGTIGVGIDAALILAAYNRMRAHQGAALSWRVRVVETGVYAAVCAGVAAELFPNVL